MILIQPNQEFQDNVIKYNRIDSLLAFGLFCIMCILLAILAVLESRYPVIEESRLAGSGINIFMIISTILLVKVRKEKFSSIGLYSGKWKQSCLIGLILALILFFNNCLLHIISGRFYRNKRYYQISDILFNGCTVRGNCISRLYWDSIIWLDKKSISRNYDNGYIIYNYAFSI